MLQAVAVSAVAVSAVKVSREETILLGKEEELDLFSVVETATWGVVASGFPNKQAAKQKRNELIRADGGELGKEHMPKNGHYAYSVIKGKDNINNTRWEDEHV